MGAMAEWITQQIGDEDFEYEEAKNINSKCSFCSGIMMLRIGRMYNNQFLGCSNYPECTFTCDSTGKLD